MAARFVSFLQYENAFISLEHVPTTRRDDHILGLQDFY